MKKIFLFLVFAPFLMGAQTMSPNLLWDLGRVSLDHISPDGKTAVYGITNYDIETNKGNRDLFIVNIKNGESSQLTDFEGSEYGTQFLSDGDIVGFTHNGQYNIFNLKNQSQAVLTQLENAHDYKVIELSNGNWMLLYSKSVKMFDETSDKYPDLEKANVRIIDDLMYRHWDHWNDASAEHLHYQIIDPKDNYRVLEEKDIMPKALWDVPTPPFGGSENYTASQDGQFIIYVAKKMTGKDWAVSTNTDIYSYNLATGETINITEGMRGYDKNPKFSPNGKLMAWTSMPRDGYESDVNELWIMDIASGFKSKLDGHKEYINDFSWADNSTIYYSFDIEATVQIGVSTLKSFEEGNVIFTDRTITSGDYNYGHFEVANKSLIAVRQDMNHANEIYKIEKGGSATAITRVNDNIYSEIKLSKIEKRWIKTTDDKEMLTWVIYPPDFDPSKKYPTLLYCQGGPQSAVSQFYSFRWNFQLMAANGYIVVAPNRRGLPGFGKKWNEDISEDWGGQSMRDYLSAIDSMAKEPYVDENNMGAIGASYGGYSVYMLAGIHEGRFKSFISHCGLYNLESWYGTTEEMFFANWDIGGNYWDQPVPKSYELFSPHKYVQHWDTPIMVIHGGKDFRVPINQGMEAFQVAQLKGIPSRFVYFPEEGHWVLNPQNGLIWHDQFFDWLNLWLKNK